MSLMLQRADFMFSSEEEIVPRFKAIRARYGKLECLLVRKILELK